MALADMDDYAAKLAAPFQVHSLAGKSVTPLASLPQSLWTGTPFAGSAPTTAAAPTKSTAGGIDAARSDPAANAYVGGATLRDGGQGWGYNILCDRLSHQGGLSGTDTTTDLTTNLPTSALTRYTDGVGVMAAIEIYTTIGSTATTITCKYTNQAGTSGQVSQPVVIGGASGFSAGRLIPISLASGDSGVRSIASSTLLATTGTAGAFGYTLFRPLAWIPIVAFSMTTDFDPLLGGCGQLTEVVDNACLFWLRYTNSGAAFALSGTLTLIEA